MLAIILAYWIGQGYIAERNSLLPFTQNEWNGQLAPQGQAIVRDTYSGSSNDVFEAYESGPTPRTVTLYASPLSGRSHLATLEPGEVVRVIGYSEKPHDSDASPMTKIATSTEKLGWVESWMIVKREQSLYTWLADLFGG